MTSVAAPIHSPFGTVAAAWKNPIPLFNSGFSVKTKLRIVAKISNFQVGLNSTIPTKQCFAIAVRYCLQILPHI